MEGTKRVTEKRKEVKERTRRVTGKRNEGKKERKELL